MSDRQSVKASFAIFTPEEGSDMDDAIAHLIKVAAGIEQSSNMNVAILKCLDHSWVAVFGVQRVVEVIEGINLPEAAAFTKGLRCPVRKVESGWFKLNSQQTRKDVPFAQISLGDIVSIRSIYKKSTSDDTKFSWEGEDTLSYSCIAILRAYFHRFKGLYSCSFFDSMDKKRIIGIAVWDTIESASFVADHPESNPALPYWKHAEQLQFHIYQAVHVTRKDCSLPGFQI